MLRAEFPVQRKRTLNMSAMRSLPSKSAADESRSVEQRLTDLGLATAAILDQVGQQLPCALGVGGIEDGAAAALALHQAGAAENAQMGRERARRYIQLPR